jgi:hypothetical protein
MAEPAAADRRGHIASRWRTVTGALVALVLATTYCVAGPQRAGAASGRAVSVGDTRAIFWPNQPPVGMPFARSARFRGATFTGPYADYEYADTWYPSWGSDGRLYSTYMDGWCGRKLAHGAPPVVMGTAVISGRDPLHLRIACSGITAPGTGYDGRYASASLSLHGVWYYGSYLLDALPPPGARDCGNYCTLGPFVGFAISRDGGRRWTPAPQTPTQPLFGESPRGGNRVQLGALHFVDFGQDNRYAPHGYAYLVGHGGGTASSQDSWISADDVYLIRVKPSPRTINRRDSYEFYAGNGRWTHSLQQIAPLIAWPGHLGPVSVTYDAPLRTYLMCVTTPSDGIDALGPYNSMLLESRNLTGPWRPVQHLRHFGPQAYFLTIPSKFISRDGRTMWLSYSANLPFVAHTKAYPRGSRYGWVLREMRLDGPRGHGS